jgi:adenylate cyclase
LTEFVKDLLSMDIDERNEMWRKTLAEGHLGLNTLRKVMGLLPGTPRCKICNNPFGGFGGHICRAIGMGPSRKSPQVCASCCEKMPTGGCEIEIAVLFADVRGSTEMAEHLGPTAYADKLNRFYETATRILVRHGATIDKLIGDEVMAFFVPGFAGPGFKRVAVEAGCTLLDGLGYGGGHTPWLPVGVGIDAGVAYVGNVGGEDYVDFTALGDPVNIAERIQADARPGELLVGDALYQAVAANYPAAKSRIISVKGKDEPITVHAVPLRPT